MKSDIRCLAVRQPFAWAIMTGEKDIENRSWTTDYRGPIVIQASSSKTEVNQTAKAGKLPPRDFVYGALLGMVDLVDVVPMSEELEANPWAFGSYCWRVANPRVFPEPIPAKGKLMLYAIQEELAERVRASLGAALPPENDELARQWLDHMARRFPVDEHAAMLLESYLALGDGVNALRVAGRTLARGRTTEALVDHARARFVADDNSGALADLEEALRKDPEDARAYFVRGLVYQGLADASIARAAELDPKFAEADSSNEDAEDDSS